MQDPVLFQSAQPTCSCGTRPDSRLWEPHIIDLFRLEQRAWNTGDPQLIIFLSELVEAHLAMEG